MGNAVIVLLLTIFAALWMGFAHKGAWALYRSVHRGGRATLKSAWYWGITLLTLGLLTSFALLGMALPLVLESIFDSSQEVSVSMIALVIVAVLALSWLVSLNRYRIRIEDAFPEA